MPWAARVPRRRHEPDPLDRAVAFPAIREAILRALVRSAAPLSGLELLITVGHAVHYAPNFSWTVLVGMEAEGLILSTGYGEMRYYYVAA